MVSKEDRKRKIINKRPLVLPNEVNGVTVRNLSRKQSSRFELLRGVFENWYDKPLYCPALKAHVIVTPQTTHEARHRCCYDKEVTYLNLNLPLIMRHASLWKTDVAKDNKQQRKMKIVEMIMLATPVKNMGIARLRIGRTVSNGYVQYTLTKVTLDKFNEEK